MRSLWRSLLSVFLAFCIVFSNSLCALAQTTTDSNIALRSINPDQVTSGYVQSATFLRYIDNGNTLTVFESPWVSIVPPFEYFYSTGTASSSPIFNADYWQLTILMNNKDNTTLIDKGDSFTFSLSDFGLGLYCGYSWSIVNVGGGGGNKYKAVDWNGIIDSYAILWSDVPSDTSQSQRIDITSPIPQDIQFSGVADFDVKYIDLWFTFQPYAFMPDSSGINGFSGWTDIASYEFAYLNSVLSIDIEDKTDGLLSGIIEWLKSIRDGITNVFDSVVEVKNSILNLPSKIQDMLVGFFVPDEETINSKFAEFETLLSDRFGLIYQSADIIHDFADSLQTQAVMVADTGGVITLPSVTVSLAGVDYNFGGFDVDVIPNGFEALQTAVRLATSMVCTVVFVNMLKNKLEAILK